MRIGNWVSIDNHDPKAELLPIIVRDVKHKLATSIADMATVTVTENIHRGGITMTASAHVYTDEQFSKITNDIRTLRVLMNNYTTSRDTVSLMLDTLYRDLNE